MLVIAGTATIDPEKRDQALGAAIEMMSATRKEHGCIEYAFSADLEDPAVIRIIEQWESQEALDAHFKAPHMAKFQQVLGELGLRGLEVKKFEVSKVSPVV